MIRRRRIVIIAYIMIILIKTIQFSIPTYSNFIGYDDVRDYHTSSNQVKPASRVEYNVLEYDVERVNPSNLLDIPFTTCIFNNKLIIVSWSNIDPDKLFYSDTYTSLLVLYLSHSNPLENIKMIKLNFSRGLDLLFNCLSKGNELLSVGIEDNMSMLYIFDEELNIVNKKRISDKDIWFTNLITSNNGSTIYLIGVKITGFTYNYVYGREIIVEELNATTYELVRRYMFKLDRDIYGIIYTIYDANTMIYVITQTINGSGMVYSINMATGSFYEVFNTQSTLIPLVNKPLNSTIYLLAERENKIYAIDTNGNIVDTCSCEFRPGHGITRCYGGIVVNNEALFVGGSLTYTLRGIKPITRHSIFVGYYLFNPLTIQGDRELAEMPKYMVEGLMLFYYKNDYLYIIYSGGDTRTDYVINIIRARLERISEEELLSEASTMQNYLKQKFSTATTGRQSNMNNNNNNQSTLLNNILLLYSITASIIIVALIGYIYYTRRKHHS